MNTYVYTIYGNIYINLTNFCSNACEFCVRNHESTMDGREFGSHSGEGDYDLWLDREPSYKDVTDILDKMDFSRYKEMVFCGYGEPSARFDLVEMLCVYAHERGIKTRINTNGQGNAINGRDITDDIVSHIDSIGVSLNATDAKKYDAICHSEWGERGFDLMLAFAEECVKKGGNVSLSVVDIIGEEETAKARTIAEKIGAKLRVRKMIDG